MRTAIVAFLFAIVLNGHPSLAIDIPPEWLACKTSADCTVVSSSCGPSMGINIHHKSKAQAEICKTENCSGGCNLSAIQAYAAICKNGHCIPDYSAKPPPAPEVNYQLKGLSISEPYCDGKHEPCGGEWITRYDPKWTACKTKADCTLVSTKCGPVTGANIDYQSEVLAENDKKEPHSKSCDAPRVPAVPVCQNGQCVPDFNH